MLCFHSLASSNDTPSLNREVSSPIIWVGSGHSWSLPCTSSAYGTMHRLLIPSTLISLFNNDRVHAANLGWEILPSLPFLDRTYLTGVCIVLNVMGAVLIIYSHFRMTQTSAKTSFSHSENHHSTSLPTSVLRRRQLVLILFHCPGTIRHLCSFVVANCSW